MRILLNLLGGLAAAAWGAVAADYLLGTRRERMLDSVPPLPVEPAVAAPSLSVIVPACNEAEKLPAAFRTLLAQEYPGPFEIVAVDDRSTDGTGEILDAMAADAPPGKRVRVLHIRELPDGWLGKTHALWQGAHHSTGKWILFTDADVHFSPDCLSRATALAEKDRLDHLVCFFRLDLRGFWENVFGLCFTFYFVIQFRPWHAADPARSNYLGVGGFNLVRRSAYEAVGTHRALAMEVVDDMMLAKRLKRAGCRADVVGAPNQVVVRWQEGLRGLTGGLIKNAYAGLHYSPLKALSSSALLLLFCVLPAVGVFAAGSGRARAAHGAAVGITVGLAALHAWKSHVPAGYALTLPLSSLMLVGVIARSAQLTERNGGISWRGTHYPLDLLRSRPVPPEPELLDGGV